jgi:hypothetical protein
MPIHLISIVDNISGKCKSTKSVLARIIELGISKTLGISILYNSALISFIGLLVIGQHLFVLPLCNLLQLIQRNSADLKYGMKKSTVTSSSILRNLKYV